VLSYLYDPDQIFQTNVARCSKALFIIGPHRPDEKLNFHATDALLKPLERLAIFAADPVPRLRIDVRHPTWLSWASEAGRFATRIALADSIQKENLFNECESSCDGAE